VADESFQDDRTEEASPERREEFREKGQIAVSREITSVVVLVAAVVFLSVYLTRMAQSLQKLFVADFESLATQRLGPETIIEIAFGYWKEFLFIIVPIFVVTELAAAGTTLAQTRLNWSWERLKPDFSRMNPLPGMARMVSMQSLVELSKGIGKMLAVGVVAYLILRSEWIKVPELMIYPIMSTWSYWGHITKTLFWSVAALMFAIAAGDYLYNFFSLEKKLKMTKQEVKEEFKRREVDPHLKGRMRRMQRDIVMRKVMEKTKDATVLITNPTHFSIALKYELGMPAPIVLAKGIDFIALKMREIAKEQQIPIVENRPLARELYASVEEGRPIPDKLYKIVAEIIRYVFKLKGRSVGDKAARKPGLSESRT
jgi:flagellar biosynthetic protein FlhB